jgi:hypothetical protein
MEEIRVILADLRSLGIGQTYCVRGCRLLCYQHGISYHKLIREGIPLSELAHIQDDMVVRIINIAKERVQNAR